MCLAVIVIVHTVRTWVESVCGVCCVNLSLYSGAFDMDCKTIYVGGISMHADIEQVMWREFGEWGTPEVGGCSC